MFDVRFVEGGEVGEVEAVILRRFPDLVHFEDHLFFADIESGCVAFGLFCVGVKGCLG